MSDNQKAFNKLQSVWMYINWILAANRAHFDAANLVSDIKHEFAVAEDVDLEQGWEYAEKWRVAVKMWGHIEYLEVTK